MKKFEVSHYGIALSAVVGFVIMLAMSSTGLEPEGLAVTGTVLAQTTDDDKTYVLSTGSGYFDFKLKPNAPNLTGDINHALTHGDVIKVHYSIVYNRGNVATSVDFIQGHKH